MGLTSWRRARTERKELERWRRELTKHMCAVTLSEDNAPTHRSLREGHTREEAESYLEYRMRLRRKWVDAFLRCHGPEIPPTVRERLRRDALDDIESFRKRMLDYLDNGGPNPNI